MSLKILKLPFLTSITLYNGIELPTNGSTNRKDGEIFIPILLEINVIWKKHFECEVEFILNFWSHAFGEANTKTDWNTQWTLTSNVQGTITDISWLYIYNCLFSSLMCTCEIFCPCFTLEHTAPLVSFFELAFIQSLNINWVLAMGKALHLALGDIKKNKIKAQLWTEFII